MNCQPGDIAFIVRTLGVRAAEPLVGKPVKVIEVRVNDPKHGPMWLMEEPIWYGGLDFHLIADAVLKPIQNPGANARDESHAWLPRVPTTTKEHA